VNDLRDGSDRLLARGAQTVAWGADGRIAYFQADHARYAAGPYLGKIVVRSLTRPSTAWTPRSAPSSGRTSGLRFSRIRAGRSASGSGPSSPHRAA
jgi:hypothetical protein